MQALHAHKELERGELARMIAEQDPIWHDQVEHPLWAEGCTCADQWVCAACGQWHRRGAPYWDWEKGDLAEVAACAKCGAARPAVVPSVPCRLKHHPEYHRFVATRWVRGRRNMVVRVQREAQLDFWSLPSYIRSSKVPTRCNLLRCCCCCC